MSKRVEATTIRDITDAADVAFGSFYTYFDSKDAILVAAVEDILIGFTDLVERFISMIEDPAEKVAVALSILLRTVESDPLRSNFLLRAELFNESIGKESRKRLVRDLTEGVEQGSFNITNVTTASHLISGIYLSYMRGRLFGLIDEGQEENTIFMALRMLGVPEEKATALAKQYGSNS